MPPAAAKLDDVTPMLTLIMYLTDLLGSYSPSAEVRKKAADARKKVAESLSRKDRGAKEEEAMKKQEEKLQVGTGGCNNRGKRIPEKRGGEL